MRQKALAMGTNDWKLLLSKARDNCPLTRQLKSTASCLVKLMLQSLPIKMPLYSNIFSYASMLLFID